MWQEDTAAGDRGRDNLRPCVNLCIYNSMYDVCTVCILVSVMVMVWLVSAVVTPVSCASMISL